MMLPFEILPLLSLEMRLALSGMSPVEVALTGFKPIRPVEPIADSLFPCVSGSSTMDEGYVSLVMFWIVAGMVLYSKIRLLRLKDC